MCNPAIIMAAVAVVSKASGLHAQRKAADHQISSINAQHDQRQEEIADAASTDMGLRAREGRKERGRIMVAAGESGLMGNTFESSLFTSFLQQEMDISTRKDDQDNQSKSAKMEANNALSRVKKPSGLSAGLQIISAGANSYMSAGGKIGGTT